MKVNTNYATVGGRIEEYAEIANNSGLEAAKKEIELVYKEETPFVYEGLKIYLKYGFDTYYTGIISQELGEIPTKVTRLIKNLRLNSKS